MSAVSPSVKRFTGFANLYDRSRPTPPEALGLLLTQLTPTPFPDLIVDLGCGSGLSSRYWADKAVQVIGVDPTPDMLAQARAQTRDPNVSYVPGFGHDTGLPAGCADIVTCSQSFHWMEPGPTLAEVARLLRPGGVFAAYDHDSFPILPNWEADAAYQAFWRRAKALDEAHRVTASVPRWPKDRHLANIQASGSFRFSREFWLHQVEMGDARRLEELAMSYGWAQSLLKLGITENEMGVDTLRAEAARTLGNGPRPWYWTTRVCVGIA